MQGLPIKISPTMFGSTK